MSIDARLSELNITLPAAPAPAANYVPYVRSGTLLFVSGQTPVARDGVPVRGRLGADVGLADGQAGAVAVQAQHVVPLQEVPGQQQGPVALDAQRVRVVVEQLVAEAAPFGGG